MGALNSLHDFTIYVCMYIYIYIYLPIYIHIVGKGVHTPKFLDQPPFSTIPPFLEIQDVPTFYRPIRKTKVLKDSFNSYP